MKSRLLGTLYAVVLIFVTPSSNAALVSNDWKTVGDNLITRDDFGLEWLDLTVTANRSYDDVSNKLGPGEEFDGWRYASLTEISNLLNSSGGDGDYNGWSFDNFGVFDYVTSFIGDLFAEENPENTNYGATFLITGWHDGTLSMNTSLFHVERHLYPNRDYLDITHGPLRRDLTHQYTGSALVRSAPAVVPVPAAVWLFGSGLIGLVGMARRKQ
ncbi:VPLPA-CTERM sorting domain-containing protein [Pseudomonadota bacterium]